MQVIYKSHTSIIAWLDSLIWNAQIAGRKISFIGMTPYEYAQLKKELSDSCLIVEGKAVGNTTYRGYTIDVQPYWIGGTPQHG